MWSARSCPRVTGQLLASSAQASQADSRFKSQLACPWREGPGLDPDFLCPLCASAWHAGLSVLSGPEETVQEKVGAQPGHIKTSAVSGTMCRLTPLGLFSAMTWLTLHRNLWLLQEQ